MLTDNERAILTRAMRSFASFRELCDALPNHCSSVVSREIRDLQRRRLLAVLRSKRGPVYSITAKGKQELETT